MSNKVVVGERFTYDFPQEGVDEKGIQAVNRYLEKAFGAHLPGDWPADWVVKKGAFSGTFPRRVATWLYKQWSIKATADQVTELGNLAAKHTVKQISYEFDFDDKLAWYRGEFGDNGSCFWSNRAGARIMMRNNHCYAIRFYKAGQGMGRAWIADLTKNSTLYDRAHIELEGQAEIAPQCKVVFNGYGFNSGALYPARILAGFLGLSYRKVQLRNGGDQGGVLWINEEGQGYIVGPAAQIDKVDYVDLNFDEINATCSHCHDEIDDEDEVREIEGRIWCYSCWEENGFTCERCSAAGLSANAYEVTYDKRGNTVMICHNCAQSEDILLCQVDEHWIVDKVPHRQLIGAGNYACEHCLKPIAEHYHECSTCHLLGHESEMKDGVCLYCMVLTRDTMAVGTAGTTGGVFTAFFTTGTTNR